MAYGRFGVLVCVVGLKICKVSYCFMVWGMALTLGRAMDRQYRDELFKAILYKIRY